MAYSDNIYTGDGVTTDWNVTFQYLDQSHIAVTVDKVLTTAGGSAYTFEWIDSTTVRVRTIIDSLPVPNGLEIRLIRRTPITTPAVVFGGGASLTSANLNKNSEYLTFALQEATDANDSFTKQYLGAFSAFPTLDNDGDALLVGASFFYTPENNLYFWNGTAWKKGDILEASLTAQTAAETAQTAAETAQTAAAASAAAAAVSDTNADASEAAALASQVAAAASETAAAASEAASAASASAASSSASTASTAASNSSASASAASSSASAAAASASAASSDAAAAAASASAASTSASNAAASASAAATSETNAAASAALAATFNPADFVPKVGGLFTGPVGIGSVSPTAQLHIAASSPRIILQDTDTGAVNQIDGDNASGSVEIRADNDNTVAASFVGLYVDGNIRAQFDGDGAAIGGGATDRALRLTGTDAIKIPVGTTGQRPGTPEQGDIRRNTTTGQWEGYDGSGWGSLGGAGLFRGNNGESGDSVNGAGDIFRVNSQTLTVNNTIGATENASAAGPLTINTGVTLTVASGGTLVIV